MIIIFDIVIFAYGVYVVYAAINMKKTQQLTSFFTGSQRLCYAASYCYESADALVSHRSYLVCSIYEPGKTAILVNL